MLIVLDRARKAPIAVYNCNTIDNHLGMDPHSGHFSQCASLPSTLYPPSRSHFSVVHKLDADNKWRIFDDFNKMSARVNRAAVFHNESKNVQLNEDNLPLYAAVRAYFTRDVRPLSIVRGPLDS